MNDEVDKTEEVGESEDDTLERRIVDIESEDEKHEGRLREIDRDMLTVTNDLSRMEQDLINNGILYEELRGSIDALTTDIGNLRSSTSDTQWQWENLRAGDGIEIFEDAGSRIIAAKPFARWRIWKYGASPSMDIYVENGTVSRNASTVSWTAASYTVNGTDKWVGIYAKLTAVSSDPTLAPDAVEICDDDAGLTEAGDIYIKLGRVKINAAGTDIISIEQHETNDIDDQYIVPDANTNYGATHPVQYTLQFNPDPGDARHLLELQLYNAHSAVAGTGIPANAGRFPYCFRDNTTSDLTLYWAAADAAITSGSNDTTTIEIRHDGLHYQAQLYSADAPAGHAIVATDHFAVLDVNGVLQWSTATELETYITTVIGIPDGVSDDDMLVWDGPNSEWELLSAPVGLSVLIWNTDVQWYAGGGTLGLFWECGDTYDSTLYGQTIGSDISTLKINLTSSTLYHGVDKVDWGNGHLIDSGSVTVYDWHDNQILSNAGVNNHVLVDCSEPTASTVFIGVNGAGTTKSLEVTEDLIVQDDADINGLCDIAETLGVHGVLTAYSDFDGRANVDFDTLRQRADTMNQYWNGGAFHVDLTGTIYMRAQGAGNDVTLIAADDIIVTAGDDVTFTIAGDLTVDGSTGWSGTFTEHTGKTVTVVHGWITGVA